MASPGTGETLDRAVDEDLTLVGRIEAVEDVHEGAFAGPVFTEQAQDLSGMYGEIHWSLARTPGNRFVIPRNSSSTIPPHANR